MLKLMFAPLRIVSGWVSGLLGRRVFDATWGLIDKEKPPQPEHRRVSLGKLALALAIDGAVFRLVRGLVDHGSRSAFARLTGRWPGAEAPDDGHDEKPDDRDGEKKRGKG
jgi:Protein of unknown function (DUF4235)